MQERSHGNAILFFPGIRVSSGLQQNARSFHMPILAGKHEWRLFIAATAINLSPAG